MAYTKIEDWKSAMDESIAQTGNQSIHKKIKSINSKGDNSRLYHLSDFIENDYLTILELKDEISTVKYQLKQISGNNIFDGSIYPSGILDVTFGTGGAATYAWLFSAHIYLMINIPNYPVIQTRIIRIIDDETEIIEENQPTTIIGDIEFFNRGDNLNTIMGHTIEDNTIEMSWLFPMSENTHNAYLNYNGIIPVTSSEITYYIFRSAGNYGGDIPTTYRNFPYQGGTTNIEIAIIEGDSEPPDKKYPYRKYYFYNKTFNIDGTRFRTLNGEYTGKGRLCGYINENKPYNITLVKKGDLLERLNDESDYHTITTLPQLTSNDTIGNYYGLLDTNIPIFNSLFDTVDYLETGDTDGAINEGDVENDSKTGKDGTIARFERANTYDILTDFNCIYDISDNIVYRGIVRWFKSLNDPSISDTIEMFWWANNPIDCVQSHYWTPLNVASLVDSQDDTPVTFGGVVATYDNDDEINAPWLYAQGKEKMLGQYQFSRKYNDWRDIDLFSYRLYLPFYGLVDLETYFIVGKRLEVKYIYYPTNHTIHYMLFVKGNLYKAIDASVGIDLPLTSADAVGKAQQTFSDIANMGGDVVGAIGSVATGNVGGVVGSITNAVSSGLSLAKKPSLIPWGNINPTTNIGDPLQALLYIEEQKTLIPNKLYDTYGHANYYIGGIGALSGYCEFSDVRLTGCDTLSDNEKEELKELLKKGVIL